MKEAELHSWKRLKQPGEQGVGGGGWGKLVRRGDLLPLIAEIPLKSWALLSQCHSSPAFLGSSDLTL